LDVALRFPGNVLFEVSLAHSVASLDALSAFKNEHEFILSPYQWFSLNCVRWDDDYQRWILRVVEVEDLPEVRSCFAAGAAASELPAGSTD
jgi:hypothetical protein